MNTMVRDLNIEELAFVSGGFSRGDSQSGQAGTTSNNEAELQDDGNGGGGGNVSGSAGSGDITISCCSIGGLINASIDLFTITIDTSEVLNDIGRRAVAQESNRINAINNGNN